MWLLLLLLLATAVAAPCAGVRCEPQPIKRQRMCSL
jgi:hypothetical protein